jgi:hypothetical protein
MASFRKKPLNCRPGTLEVRFAKPLLAAAQLGSFRINAGPKPFPRLIRFAKNRLFFAARFRHWLRSAKSR